jgi:hypothetical protein
MRLLVSACLLVVPLAGIAPTQWLTAAEEESKCITCHKGIEPIREAGSGMMQEILDVGKARGDSAGCVVCHGGDPKATEKEVAHGGRAFYPEPSSPWINKNTCGRCHPDHTKTQWHSLMMTEAGKIHGVTWAFGSLTGYEHKYANYDVRNPEDPAERIGTEAYRDYMTVLKEREPQVFVDRHVALPPAPTDPAQLIKNPELAAFTYLRNQCLRCHHAVKGRQVRGDYRGMGCSSCHIPYGNEGLYEGDDESIARDEPGHCLVHSIQATREAKVVVHDHEYSGIPIETCTTCHDRGKRIGVSFQGLMETAYHSPYTTGGEGQPALHTKHYLAMHQDIHYQKGMTCQDCHTSIDVHSDGFLAAANLGAVQIECADCHGTPDAYPWELPLGYGDEYQEYPVLGSPRGTGDEQLSRVRQGTVYPIQNGYILTARGNPYSNVVRKGSTVIVHTAAGKDITLDPLRLTAIRNALTESGRVAMQTIGPHVKRMECYTCHAAWVPQCYGCHVRIDYSDGKTCFDWLGAGHRHMQPECAADRGESTYDMKIPGAVHEERSFLRWEDPPLGVNGEGRVTPVAPGCQPSVTVVGADGEAILLNHIYRTMPGSEGAGDEGQLAIDMSPSNPHTATDTPRTCESCHASEKALGYGINGGRDTRRPDRAVIVDLETVDGHILSQNAKTQMEPIEGLEADWSRFVTEDGKQLQTVGHHFTGSRPLNDRERAAVDREGACLSCHQEIPEENLAVSFLHHVAEYTDQIPKTADEHNNLLHKILLVAAWGQFLGAILGPIVALVALVVIIRWWRRRREEVY